MNCSSAETRGLKAGEEICLAAQKDNTKSIVEKAKMLRRHGVRLVLLGSTFVHNADVHLVMARNQQIYDRLMLWPFLYASMLPGMKDAPYTFGDLTYA